MRLRLQVECGCGYEVRVEEKFFGLRGMGDEDWEAAGLQGCVLSYDMSRGCGMRM